MVLNQGPLFSPRRQQSISGSGFKCQTGDGVLLAFSEWGPGMSPTTRHFLAPNVNIAAVEKCWAKRYKYLR